MEDSKFWDGVFSTASWIIVIALFYGAAAVWLVPPSGSGPFAQLLGVTGAQVFYSLLYGTEAFALGYSKFFKKKNLRKNALLAIYLTGFFTSILIIIISGFVPGVIDNLILATLASGCWLYWKFKTEYLTPNQFYNSTCELRDDLPPNP